MAGAAAAIAIEILMLFGLRPLRVWVTVAVILGAGGALLAWVDSAQDRASKLTYRIAVASLVVAIVSLLFAGVTYFAGLTWLE